MNTTTSRKVRATIDFRPTVYSRQTGDPTNWDGVIVSPTGGPVVDRHSGQVNPRYRCWLRVNGETPERGAYLLMTQGDQPGSRRYRYGTFTEMIEAAEKWAARRYYAQEVAS